MMKKVIIFLACSMPSLLLSMLQPIPDLYIENYYGAMIFCDTDRRKIGIASNGKPVKIGTVELGGRVFCDSVSELSIKTAWSSPTSLDNYLETIVAESFRNREKEAVLMIKESSVWSPWNIQLLWRARNKNIINFSMQSPEEEEQTIERQLQLGTTITAESFLDLVEKEDLYGQEYARKVKELREIDYAAAQRKNNNNSCVYVKLHSFGYPSLLIVLGGIRFNYEQYKTSVKNDRHDHPGNRTPDEVRDFIKKLIDKNYDTFLEYKKNGWLDENK